MDAVPGKQFDGKIKSMSSTASANVMSSDPAKKFDVVFSIDMRELLTALGAKPDEVTKILATADANRKKPPVASFGGMAAMMGGGGMPGGMPGGAPPGMGAPGAAGTDGPRRMTMTMGGPDVGGVAGGAGMPDGDRQKMREAIQ